MVIVGAGPAGMAAALSAYENGVRDILLLERDQYPGGILNQCVHTRLWPDLFQGKPHRAEYAHRFIERIKAIKEIEVSLRSFVVKLTREKRAHLY